MARAFTPQQRTSIEQVLALLQKILDCAEGLPVAQPFETRKATLREELDGLRDMLARGRINRQGGGADIQAETDMFGIHVNDRQGMFDLPGDLHLADCEEGYFRSAWLVAAMLFHEKYHYDHHTGFFGGLLRPLPELLVGGMGLWLNTLLGGTTYRTHVHKEYASYLWSYAMLGTLSYLLGNVSSERPDCLPCCEAHLQWLQDARERQNPWSTYGD